MSPLTKILIVLLTVSSILLCGIVVAYVGSATDYKRLSEDYKTQLQAARQSQNNAIEELKQKKQQFEQTEQKLLAQISDLKAQLSKTQMELASAEREKTKLMEEADKWKAITADFSKTNAEQNKLLENTLAELDKARAERAKLKKELDETSNTLIQKLAIIETLEKKIKVLEEETAELRSRLNKPLIPLGKEAAPASPVTETGIPSVAGPAPVAPPVTDINLKGVVTSVDMKNSMASISLGSVDGVQEGMRFHVTRGDEFICDIVIISVDVEESVGVLELVQQPPQAGDNASTNL